MQVDFVKKVIASNLNLFDLPFVQHLILMERAAWGHRIPWIEPYGLNTNSSNPATHFTPST